MNHHLHHLSILFSVVVVATVLSFSVTISAQATCGCNEPAEFKAGERFTLKDYGFSQYWTTEFSPGDAPHELTIKEQRVGGSTVLKALLPDGASWQMDMGERFIVLRWWDSAGAAYIRVYPVRVNADPANVKPILDWAGMVQAGLAFLDRYMEFQTYSPALHSWTVNIYDMMNDTLPDEFYSYTEVADAMGGVTINHNRIIVQSMSHLTMVDATTNLPLLTTAQKAVNYQFSGCGAVMGVVSPAFDTAKNSAFIYSMVTGATLAEETYDKRKSVQYIVSNKSYSLVIGTDTLNILPVTCDAPCPIDSAGMSIGLEVSPTPVASGAQLTGTITLFSPPETDRYYNVSCDPQLLHTSPVLILAGQSSGTFSFLTDLVVTPTGIILTVDGGPTATDTILPPPPSLAQFFAFNSSVESGATVRFYFNVFLPPDSGVEIALSSSDPAVLPAPASIKFGYQYELSIPTPHLGEDQTVTLTATYNGKTSSVDVKILGPQPSLYAADLCLTGGQKRQVHLELTSPAPAGGLTVPVMSADTAFLRTPASITVPGGATTVSFEVSTVPVLQTDTSSIGVTLNGTTIDLIFTILPQSGWHLAAIPPPDTNILPSPLASTAFGINSFGDVVGTTNGLYGKIGFIFHNGTSSALPGDADVEINPYAISDSGVIAGSLTDRSTSIEAPALLYSGVWTRLGKVEGRATTVNMSGHAAGWLATASGRHAFFYGDTLRDIGTLGGDTSEAACINASDVITGWSYKDATVKRPFIWSQAEGMRELPVPSGSRDAFALAVNRGEIVAGYYIDSVDMTHACKWEKGKFRELDSLPSRATSVNDTGFIVGVSDNRPVLWDGEKRYELDSVTGFSCSFNSVEPIAINDYGQILGNRHEYFGEGQFYLVGELLSMPQEPSSRARRPARVNTPAPVLPFLGAATTQGTFSVRCMLESATPARLELYAVSGKRVAVRDIQGSGMQVVEFKGSGAIATGLYLVRLQQGTRREAIRIAFVK